MLRNIKKVMHIGCIFAFSFLMLLINAFFMKALNPSLYGIFWIVAIATAIIYLLSDAQRRKCNRGMVSPTKDNEVEFSSLLGKTLISIAVTYSNGNKYNLVRFYCDDGKIFELFIEPDCAENVYEFSFTGDICRILNRPLQIAERVFTGEQYYYQVGTTDYIVAIIYLLSTDFARRVTTKMRECN